MDMKTLITDVWKSFQMFASVAVVVEDQHAEDQICPEDGSIVEQQLPLSLDQSRR